MEVTSGAYFDPDFDSQLDRFPQPGVCIDNDICEDCTLIKVDSANRKEILLDMVQVLTDLDLVISKSYISSDGGWLMDVFHVTDQLGKKLTDPAAIHYIQQYLVAGSQKEASIPEEVMTCLGKVVGPQHLQPSEYTALEVTATDHHGILSEISAVLSVLDCYLVSCQAWTHNRRSAVIIYIVEETTGEPVSDPDRLAHIQSEVESVVGAHLGEGDRQWRVKVSAPTPGRIHTERRLHQMMHEDRDYKEGPTPRPVEEDEWRGMTSAASSSVETRVSIDSWKEKGYSIVNVRSRDRPKLLFDTVCTLTDMQYLVFHASVLSYGSLAIQEYYIRHTSGYTFLDSESERQRVSRSLVAAVERRVCHGLRVDVSTRNRKGLLSDMTRAIREAGLSLTRTECATRGEMAVGTFYVTDASSSSDIIDHKRLEMLSKELGEGITVKMSSIKKKTDSNSCEDSNQGRRRTSSEMEQPRLSLGSILWSHIGRFSINFGTIRS